MAAEQVKKHYVLGVFPFLLGIGIFCFIHVISVCILLKKISHLKIQIHVSVYQIFNLMEDENSYLPVHIFCEFLLSPKSQRK